MSPEVEAAIIAAGVGILTLIGAIYGTHKTSQDTKDALNEQLTEQGKQLDKTFAEQRDQLDKTLRAQSDQLERTLTEQRTRTLNERFATATGQMGSDTPAVRLAGVYAMGGLADDWEENRQTCVDVLCAYLRLPYAPDPGEDAPAHKRLDFQASREVRHTVIRVITAHLQLHAKPSWQGLYFDFRGAVFDGGEFTGANFSGDARANFSRAEFSSGVVRFDNTRFTDGVVDFRGAKFSGSTVSFGWARFTGGAVNFNGAEFSGGEVRFDWAGFRGGRVDLGFTKFSGATVDFEDAKFSGSEVYFFRAQFSDGTVSFGRTRFSGGTVSFDRAEFSGGQVDFSDAGDWSVPPEFPWTGAAPSGVKLPEKKTQSQD